MFSTNCTNKGCGKLQEPYLDDNKVICSICDQEISNISPFMKNQMKANKQVKKSGPLSFAMKCSCGTTDRPILKNKIPICQRCKKPLKLSPIYSQMLNEFLKGADKEII